MERQRRLIIVTGANSLDPQAPHAAGTAESKWWACGKIASILGSYRTGVLVLVGRRSTAPEEWAADLAIRRRIRTVEFDRDGRKFVNDFPMGKWWPEWHNSFPFVQNEHRSLARNGAMMRAAKSAASKGWAVEVHALASPWGKSPHMLHVATCARNAGFTVDMHFCPQSHSAASVAVADAAKGRALAKDRGPWVYFIADDNGFIKIGWSGDVAQRLADLQSAHARPLKVVLQIPGDAATERKMHKLFAEYRMSGEWFRHGSRIKSFVWRAAQKRQRGAIDSDDVLDVLADTEKSHPGG